MASFTGQLIKDTYDGIIKTIDNGVVDSTAKNLTDGVGSLTPLWVSTTQLGVGVTPSTDFHVNGSALIGGSLTITGDLTVNGTTTTISTQTLSVEDPLIILAKDNAANSVDIGFYGKYVDGSTKYAGFFRKAGDNKFHIFSGLGAEPTTTVNTGDASYVVSTLVGNLEGNVTGNLIATGAGATQIASDVRAVTQAAADSSTKVATTAFVQQELTGSDLDFSGTSGTGSVDLDSQVFAVVGTSNEIETTAGSQQLQIGMPNDVTIGNDLTVSNDLDVTGVITTAGVTEQATQFLFTKDLKVHDTIPVITLSDSNNTGADTTGDIIWIDSGSTQKAIISLTGGNLGITSKAGALNFGTNSTNALTIDTSQDSVFEGTITTGGGSGSGGALTVWGGYAQNISQNGGTVTAWNLTNAATASGTSDTTQMQISQKDTGGSAINLKIGQSADGKAFFGSKTVGIKITNASGNTEITGSLAIGGNATAIASWVTESQGIASNDNDTTVPTSAAVKDYVDTNVTAQDLDFSGTSGTGSVDLDSQTFAVIGTANEIETSASSQTLTIGLPSDVTIGNDLTVTGIVETDKIFITKGQNVAHGASQLRISQESTTTSELRFYGADSSTAGILRFLGSSSDGSVGGTRLTLNADGSSTFAGNINGTGLELSNYAQIKVDDAEIYWSNTANNDYWRWKRDASNNFILDHYNGSSTTAALSFDSSQNVSITANVGIGFTTVPSKPLNVVSAYSSGTITTSLKLATLGGYNSGSGTALEFGQDQGTYATWVSGKISSPRTGDNYGGSLTFSTNRNSSATDIVEAMRIDDNGNVGIATSAIPTNGYIASGGGWKMLQIGQSSQIAAYGTDDEIAICQNTYLNSSGAFQAITSNVAGSSIILVDGVIRFKNATTSGTTQTTSTRMTIATSGEVTPGADNAQNFGSSSLRWSLVYSANGVNTSDETLKENIKECDLGIDFINTLKPKSYNFKGLDKTHQFYGKKHYGLIAQDLKDGLLKDSVDGEKDGEYGLMYNDLIAPMIKAIQELKAEIETLKTQINK